MIALTHAKIAGRDIEVRIEPLVSEPHPHVQERPLRHCSASGSGAFLIIVHIVYLKLPDGPNPLMPATRIASLICSGVALST